MLAWVSTLAWPVAAVWISANARKAVAAVALAIWPKRDDEETKEVIEAALGEARAVIAEVGNLPRREDRT